MRHSQLAHGLILLGELCIIVCGAVDFSIEHVGSCTEDVELAVKYTGSGSVDIVSWKFSQMTDTLKTLNILTSVCQAAPGADTAFPISRMTYDCDDTDKIYKITISPFNSTTDTGTWEARVSVSGTYTDFNPINIECETTITTTTTTKPTTTTTTKPTTTTSSLTTTTTPVTTPSTTSLSDEMIIVIVVVPVGVLAVVGTVIFFCLFYRLQRGKRKPANHERHKQGKHYKDDIRPVQQHQQQPYILYGRGHARESNHRETKRSQSLHNDDRYNWYDGYHWGSQVKQNPVYKDNRNFDRLYYNGLLLRNDDYRSRYTKWHVYPSHTSGYQYGPDYHGESRRHRNRQYSSYPVYSTQQEYIDPSFSYMGY